MLKAPVGVSLIVDAEVNFKEGSVSLDYKPRFKVRGGRKVFAASSALTLRYIPFQRNNIFTLST